jgi:hypothetical protein
MVPAARALQGKQLGGRSSSRGSLGDGWRAYDATHLALGDASRRALDMLA